MPFDAGEVSMLPFRNLEEPYTLKRRTLTLESREGIALLPSEGKECVEGSIAVDVAKHLWHL